MTNEIEKINAMIDKEIAINENSRERLKNLFEFLLDFFTGRKEIPRYMEFILSEEQKRQEEENKRGLMEVNNDAPA